MYIEKLIGTNYEPLSMTNVNLPRSKKEHPNTDALQWHYKKFIY